MSSAAERADCVLHQRRVLRIPGRAGAAGVSTCVATRVSTDVSIGVSDDVSNGFRPTFRPPRPDRLGRVRNRSRLARGTPPRAVGTRCSTCGFTHIRRRRQIRIRCLDRLRCCGSRRGKVQVGSGITRDRHLGPDRQFRFDGRRGFGSSGRRRRDSPRRGGSQRVRPRIVRASALPALAPRGNPPRGRSRPHRPPRPDASPSARYRAQVSPPARPAARAPIPMPAALRWQQRRMPLRRSPTQPRTRPHRSRPTRRDRCRCRRRLDLVRRGRLADTVLLQFHQHAVLQRQQLPQARRPRLRRAVTGAAPAGSFMPGTWLPDTGGVTAPLADDGTDWIVPLHTCGPLAPATGAAGCMLSTADAPWAAEAPTDADAPAAVATLAPLTGAACTAGATGADCTVDPGCGADAPCCATAVPPDAAAGADAAAAPDAADAAEAAAGTTAAPVASSAGTVSVAPTFRRLASRFMNACGLASNSAGGAREHPGSRDCVAAFAMSFSDWPGWTVTVSGAAPSAADAGSSPVPAARPMRLRRAPGSPARHARRATDGLTRKQGNSGHRWLYRRAWAQLGFAVESVNKVAAEMQKRRVERDAFGGSVRRNRVVYFT